MKISLEQLKGKPRKIGTSKGKPVFEILTKGGLAIVVYKGVILGAAPHIAIAKFQARQKEPYIMWDELSKNGEEQFIVEAGRHLIPYLDDLVSEMNKRMVK